jgi:hypothetical protein
MPVVLEVTPEPNDSHAHPLVVKITGQSLIGVPIRVVLE